jgi:hypothetical protein
VTNFTNKFAMKQILYFLFTFLFSGMLTFAQVSIGTDNSTPSPSAGLDVKFTDKGFLPPRLTQSQILAIPYPADGLMVFCTDDSKIYVYVSTLQQWKELLYGSGSLIPQVTCGLSFTINHYAGYVAPVNKTVTYGTVTNITGETGKCWITSNLGADHQAASVDDSTEASAGWYWQFNRKQGYKHNGIYTTPYWAGTNISENSDWISVNDPCSILLGAAWRIPTYTEWNNVDSLGGWNNWYGPWFSLKLHAAGCVYYNSLLYRGSQGRYWGSTQTINIYAYFLYIDTNGSYMAIDDKGNALPLRCLREL